MMLVASAGEGDSVSRAIKALETILSPVASSSERASANQYCEGVKGNVEESLHLAKTFIPYGAGYPVAVRQFGLNLLEHVVKSLGRSEALPEQGLLEQLWGLAFGPSGLDADQGEPSSVKEKTAVVVVQAALRVWPQRWPGLVDMLLGELGCMTAAGPTSGRQVLNSELALTVLRMLCEEIHQSSDVDSVVSFDEARRTELQGALAAVLPGLADWVWAALPMAASRSTPNDAASMRLLSALIKAFGAVCQWVVLKPETTPLVVGTLFNIVQVYAGLREDALEALLQFSARPMRTNDETLLTVLFDQEAGRLEQILTALVQKAGGGGLEAGEDDEACYHQLKKVAEIIVNMATTYIAHRKHPALPKRLGPVLGILLGLLALPSLIVQSLAVIFWVAAMKAHSSLFEHAAFQAVLPALFMRLLGAMAAERRQERRQAWNRLDFDTEKEFDEVFLATTNRQTCLLDQLALRHDRTAEYLRAAVGSFAGEHQAALKSRQAPAARLLGQWAALCTATEAICRGSRSPAEPVVALMGSLLDGFLGVVDPAETHPDVLAAWLVAVKGLAVALGAGLAHPGLIPGVLSLVMSYRPAAGRAGGAPDPSEMLVRGRSSALLVRLAQAAPALFLPHLEALAELQAACPPAAVLQQRFFTELFLTVAGTIGDAGRRVDFVDRVVRPFLEELDRAMPWLEPDALRRAAGATPALVMKAGEQAVFRKSLSNILHLAFLVVTRLGQQPDLAALDQLADYVRGTVVPRLLAFLLQLLRAVQRLQDPRAWPAPDEQALWHELFARRQSDATNVQGAMDPAEEAAPADSNPVQTVRGWFSTVLVSALVSTGYAARLPGFYGDLAGLAEYLGRFEPATCSLWSATWTYKHLLHPLLAGCPGPQALGPAFGGALDRVLAGTLARLQGEWAGLLTQPADDPAAEVEREAELVMVSGVVVNMLYDVLYPAGERDKRAEPFLDLTAGSQPGLPVQSPTAVWLATADAGRQETLVQLLACGLGWRQSVGLNKLLLLALRWLPALAASPALHESLFSTGLLPAALTLLARPGSADYYPGAAQLVAELYKWAIFLRYDAAVERTLLSLPHTSADALAVLKAGLLEPGRTSKAHRDACRAFFKPMQAILTHEASGKAFVVPRLPEKLVLLKRLKEEVPDPVTEDMFEALFA